MQGIYRGKEISMKKNSIVLVAILVITALLAGCGGGNATPTTTTPPSMGMPPYPTSISIGGKVVNVRSLDGNFPWEIDILLTYPSRVGKAGQVITAQTGEDVSEMKGRIISAQLGRFGGSWGHDRVYPVRDIRLSPLPSPMQTTQWQISSTKYIFIDHHINRHGELIEGENLRENIGVPAYSFNKETDTLTSMRETDFEINESLILIYGLRESLSGSAGSGAWTHLWGVYELPSYELPSYEPGGLKILYLETNGTAHLEYNKVSIVLKSGEQWSNTESIIATRDWVDQTAKLKLTITDTIVNYGSLDKSKIVIPN